MKVGPTRFLGDEVALPLEVISQILYFLFEPSTPLVRQNSLWSCCLLSKDWYSVAISQLYAVPILTTRNFDQFARTLCPSISAHAPTIGLETFVKRLDMGHLAYVSSRSQTARLLRRTGSSLEVFIPPAVTFSTSSLAPLSKCSQLITLELPHHFPELTLEALLHATRNLQRLQRLSLPTGIFTFRSVKRWSVEARWPPNLQELQLNSYPSSYQYWEYMASMWPSSLSTLAFEAHSELSAETVRWPDHGGFHLPHITSVRFGAGCGETCPLYSLAILSSVPGFRKLSIPASWINVLSWLLNTRGLGNSMTTMELRDFALASGSYKTCADHFVPFRNLNKIRVDKTLVGAGDGSKLQLGRVPVGVEIEIFESQPDVYLLSSATYHLSRLR